MKFLLFGIATFLYSCSSGQTTDYNAENGLAIDGYDPLSYFSEHPEKGDKNINAVYKGLTFRFTSEEHKLKFNGNPEKYEPAYGGWCAYAMGASGEKVSVNPKTYKIIDGRLYLFYNSWGNNTLESWNENESVLKKRADENWSQIAK